MLAPRAVRADPAAGGGERCAPGADGAHEREHESDHREHEPVLFGAGQGVERGLDVVAQQPGSCGNGDHREQCGRRENEL